MIAAATVVPHAVAALHLLDVGVNTLLGGMIDTSGIMTAMSGTMTAVTATSTAGIVISTAGIATGNAPEARMTGNVTSRTTEIDVKMTGKGAMMNEEAALTEKTAKVSHFVPNPPRSTSPN